jgi:hypothetical protein
VAILDFVRLITEAGKSFMPQPIDEDPGKPVHIRTRTGPKPLLSTNSPSGRPARDAAREASSKAIAQEARMAIRGPHVEGWTVVLRRQPVRMVEGRAEGGYADVFELICCDCGDDPDLDYREVAPRLQLVRGPYLIADGIVAYEQHRRRHQQLEVTCRPGLWPMRAERR